MKLSAIINVDKTKCVNCHQCISVCPVKFCMDGSSDTIELNHELCIGCGSCIEACSHGARTRLDDFEAFIRDIEIEKMIAIVAPAIASSYPGMELKINGLLKSMGVEACFDVSFGAELTVTSYLDHIEKNSPKAVIAQPCPAIVNYIEIFQPELIKHLAPADSPMLHTIKMIREYFPEFKEHKVVIISPCLAKKREFEETGIGDYNVTFYSLQNHIDMCRIDLDSIKDEKFFNPDPERAVLFPCPGGLMKTVERESPELVCGIRKVEGPDIVYDYLKSLPAMIDKGFNPLLIDCLNCEKGCNGGTGTRVGDKSQDELEFHIKARAEKQISKNRNKIGKSVKKLWKPGLYAREYIDRSELNRIEEPDNKELWEIYNFMEKSKEEDLFNCSSCGYNSCKDMAKAIFNGLNKPENCHHYQISIINRAKEKQVNLSEGLNSKIEESSIEINHVNQMVSSLLEKTTGQSAVLEETTACVNEMMRSITEIDKTLKNRKSVVHELQTRATSKIAGLKEMVKSIEDVVSSVDKVHGFNKTINSVARNTNLLAMNAAIEAAHAGDHGLGFSVVASEIRKLAVESGNNASNVSNDLKKITTDIERSKVFSIQNSKEMEFIISEFSDIADSLADLSRNMTEMSDGSIEIAGTMNRMVEQCNIIEDFGREMDSVVTHMTDIFNELYNLSKSGEHIME